MLVKRPFDSHVKRLIRLSPKRAHQTGSYGPPILTQSELYLSLGIYFVLSDSIKRKTKTAFAVLYSSCWRGCVRIEHTSGRSAPRHTDLKSGDSTSHHPSPTISFDYYNIFRLEYKENSAYTPKTLSSHGSA